ncbi:MAG: NAD-glutamate dehydrogenase [Alphaproteobacteria bacterium]|nr:NAD-glutamate dehydrogenase [Alphaproteobacteria bacterium]
MARADEKDRRDERIQSIVKLALKGLKDTKRGQAKSFFQQYFAQVPLEDLEAVSPADLAGAAHHHWRAAQRRKDGETLVRVFNPDKGKDGWAVGHTVVEIVTPDMPFLVDSVSAEINRRGFSVHMTIHPVVRVRRTKTGQLAELFEPGLLGVDMGAQAESLIHLEIDEQTEARHADIHAGVMEVLGDVKVAVGDWRSMRAVLEGLIDELESLTGAVPLAEVSEVRDFLRWLHDDNFTLLGYREYEFVGAGDKAEVRLPEHRALGILRDPGRVVFEEIRNIARMPPQVRGFVTRRDLMMITKTEAVSRVHRPVQMDSVGIKRLDAAGRVVGERIFVGLFTASAYNKGARDIPLLNRKIQRAFDLTGLQSSSHSGKAFLNILETYPRDELLQISVDTLKDIGLGILRLQDRQKVALFVRRDDFERYLSCLVFVPRDRYTTDLRRKMQEVLEDTFGGVVTAHAARLGEQPLARLHVVVKTTPGQIPKYDHAEVERRLAELARSWADRLGGALIERHGEMEGMRLLDNYQDAFSRSYEDRFTADESLDDIALIESALDCGRIGLNLYQLDAKSDGPPVRFKVYHPGHPAALSDVMPVLENLGLRVVEEIPFRVRPKDAPCKYIIHDFGLEPRHAPCGVCDDIRRRFHDAFDQVWLGRMESDPLNALILAAGLDWREVTVLRAYTKYLRQTGVTYSEAYMAETLVENSAVTRAIVDLFMARFAIAADDEDRARTRRRAQRLDKKLHAMLDDVASADQDRILRRYINLVNVTLRTNFHQTGADGEPKTWLSFKFSSRDIEDLPLPRPRFEIFVYAPEVEGVHLRFGPVARGGLRWSDRREDFRTEILGLVKAQQVKNAVIVPVGSKGGFVVKTPPQGATRETLLRHGIGCYKTFVRGLLDVTDNLDAEGRVLPPPDVARHDGDDPYLVVAADKGTATFSDIANGVSAEYGFWLGDAFASGGSKGYDHKKMGITARGAWESVKRHFREMGADIQAEDFTVVGVGDMSGDVFGNGMLLSRHIRLRAAFNHMHVFVDPNPDAAKSFAERQRLFAQDRSTWADYDAKLISKGGGVFDRSAKTIALTREMKALFGTNQDKMSPNEMIRAILRVDVDLLWFGGIGTYVKARHESHADAGDRANDAVRVDAHELGARVVGEGANLGVTQLGRIEYALAGGRINTDSIDNSAGVDCSDHEVNIKILLDRAVAQGKLTPARRDATLERMTREVAELVLWDNYEQTLAISIVQARGRDLADHQSRLMRMLEKSGRLNRAVEFLPDEEALGERMLHGKGLMRPELAVLMSYSKIWLYDELLASTLPDDPLLNQDLKRYFPTPLRKDFAEAIDAHRLRREIVATRVTNSLVNRVGGTFITQHMEKTGMKPDEIARAFIVARETYGVRDMWAPIKALDNKIPARVQIQLLLDVNRLLDRATAWFLRNEKTPLDLEAAVGRYQGGIAELARALKTALPVHYREDLEARAKAYVLEGVPRDLARVLAGLVNLASGADIVQLATARKLGVAGVAQVYFAVGAHFRLGRMRAACERIEGESHWQKLAVAALMEELYAHQRHLTDHVLEAAENETDPARAIRLWTGRHGAAIERTEQLLGELWAGDITDVSMIAVASRALKALADEPAPGEG